MYTPSEEKKREAIVIPSDFLLNCARSSSLLYRFVLLSKQASKRATAVEASVMVYIAMTTTSRKKDCCLKKRFSSHFYFILSKHTRRQNNPWFSNFDKRKYWRYFVIVWSVFCFKAWALAFQHNWELPM